MTRNRKPSATLFAALFAVALFALLPGTALAATMGTSRASVGAGIPGTQGDGAVVSSGPGLGPAVSADGRYVVFDSLASNLVTAGVDTNTVSDVYRRDRLTGQTVLVSRATGVNGAVGDLYSQHPSVSADGRFVAFQSDATNLVANDTNAATDIFVRDVTNNTTTRVSVATGGQQAGSDSYTNGLAISADGTKIVFESDATTLTSYSDTNGLRDVFIRNTANNTTDIISRPYTGWLPTDAVHLAGDSTSPVISGNGLFVAFWSHGYNLLNNDTNTFNDVFLRDLTTNTTQFVSTANGTVGTASSIANGDTNQQSLSISNDGHKIAFASDASNLVAGDTNAQEDVFVRDAVANTTTRVSLAPNGTQLGDFSQLWKNPALSPDGGYIAFESEGTTLVAGDTNGVADIFIRNLAATSLVRASLAYDGSQGNDFSYSRPAVTDGGRYVVFVSAATNLVANDTNGVNDDFIRDTKPPHLTASGISGSWVKTDVLVSLVATGGVAPVKAFYTYGATTASPNAPATATVTAEGDTLFSYYAIDANGDAEATQTAHVKIDKTAPTMGSDAVAFYKTSASITASATDALSGVSSMTHGLDGAPQTSGATISGVTGLGAHTGVFTATDIAGNVSTLTVNFTVVAMPHVTAVATPSTWTSGNVAVGMTATGGMPPVKAYYSYGATTASATAPTTVTVTTEGDTTFSYRAIDASGDTEPTQTVHTLIDRTGPTMGSDAVATYKGNAAITATAVDSLSGVASSHYVLDNAAPVAGLSLSGVTGLGSHTATFTATDSVGNSSTLKVTFVVASAPHLVASGIPAGWTNANVDVSLVASGGIAPVKASYAYGVTSAAPNAPTTVTVSVEGDTLFSFRAIDASGDAEATQTAHIKIDKTGPTWAAVTTTTLPSPASITATPTDSLSGVASTTHSLDGAAATSGTSISGVTASGAPAGHTVVFTATDNAGNTTTQTVNFTVTPAGKPTPTSERYAGYSLFDTAALMSQRGWPAGAVSVPTASGPQRIIIVAAGRRWQDALMAGGLAGIAKAPIVLSESTRTPNAATTTEIKRLRPTKVYVVGDLGGVNAANYTTITAAAQAAVPGATVVRLGSASAAATTYYATGLAVANEIKALRIAAGGPGTGGTLIVATESKPYDALAASTVAARLGAPIILVPNSPASPVTAIPANDKTAIQNIAPARVLIVGGRGVISEAMGNQAYVAAGLPAPATLNDTDRWWGNTLYDTAAIIGLKGWEMFGAPADGTMFLATGQNFPDALAAGPLAAGISGQGTYGTAWHPLLLSVTSATSVLSPQVGWFINGDTAKFTTGTKPLPTAVPKPSLWFVGGIGGLVALPDAILTGAVNALK